MGEKFNAFHCEQMEIYCHGDKTDISSEEFIEGVSEIRQQSENLCICEMPYMLSVYLSKVLVDLCEKCYFFLSHFFSI